MSGLKNKQGELKIDSVYTEIGYKALSRVQSRKVKRGHETLKPYIRSDVIKSPRGRDSG